MRYKCLVFDHDDTVVNSTATIHHPCFEQYLCLRYSGRHCTLEEYFLKNFDPGFMQMCQNEYGMDDAALQDETEFWKKYVAQHIPSAYPGMNELMCRHKAEGGYICVVSHSFDENIRRDYAENGLPGAGSGVRLGAAARAPQAKSVAAGGDNAPAWACAGGAADDRRPEARL